MVAISRVTTRFTDGLVHAYDLSNSPVESAAGPVAVFPIAEAVELESHAVAPNLRRAVYATADEMVCIDREGKALWRLSGDPDSGGGVRLRPRPR
jgi:hypothetical protein